LLRGCTSNGDRDRPTPENRWQGLLTQQQRDRQNHYQGTAPYRLLPIRCRSRWAGSEPGFRPIRFDGSRGRLPDCRASGFGVVWFLRILQATPPPRGGRVDSSEIGNQFGDRFGIDLKVIPAAPVWGLSRSTLPEQLQQVSIGAALAGSMVESLIILNPEGNVPGFPVCPSVVGFGLGSGGGRHRVGFVWFLLILQHRRGHPVPPLCQLPDCHQTMGVPSLSVTVPASLSAAIESKICRSSSPLAARFSRAEASSKVMIKCKTVWFELGCL